MQACKIRPAPFDSQHFPPFAALYAAFPAFSPTTSGFQCMCSSERKACLPHPEFQHFSQKTAQTFSPSGCVCAAGLCTCTLRLRGGRQGSALHPLGLRPRPRDANASLLACGRDGSWAFCPSFVLCAPPARTAAGGAGQGIQMGGHPLSAQPHKKSLAQRRQRLFLASLTPFSLLPRAARQAAIVLAVYSL